MVNGPHPHIGWVDDPSKLSGLIRDKPDRELQPFVVGEYNAKPKGASRADLQETAVWCSECQERTHWQGYVVTDQNGGLYLIGSRCGRLHYGGERFVLAKRSYDDRQKRNGLLERRAQILAVAADLRSELSSAVASDGVAAIAAKRAELKSAHADLAGRLASSAASGTPLTEMVRVRGAKGKMEFTQMSVGRLEGAAIVHNTFRGRVTELHSAIEALIGFDDESEGDHQSTKALETLVRSAERAASDALEQWRGLAQANRFFMTTNIRRLVRWSVPYRRFFSIVASDGGGFVVQAEGREPRIIRPLEAIALPRLKILEQAAG